MVNNKRQLTIVGAATIVISLIIYFVLYDTDATWFSTKNGLAQSGSYKIPPTDTPPNSESNAREMSGRSTFELKQLEQELLNPSQICHWHGIMERISKLEVSERGISAIISYISAYIDYREYSDIAADCSIESVIFNKPGAIMYLRNYPWSMAKAELQRASEKNGASEILDRWEQGAKPDSITYESMLFKLRYSAMYAIATFDNDEARDFLMSQERDMKARQSDEDLEFCISYIIAFNDLVRVKGRPFAIPILDGDPVQRLVAIGPYLKKQ